MSTTHLNYLISLASWCTCVAFAKVVQVVRGIVVYFKLLQILIFLPNYYSIVLDKAGKVSVASELCDTRISHHSRILTADVR